MTPSPYILGLPGSSNDKESTCQCRRHRSNPWVRKIPWRRKWQPTPVFLPGESHGQRSLAGYSPCGHRVGHDWATKNSTAWKSLLGTSFQYYADFTRGTGFSPSSLAHFFSPMAELCLPIGFWRKEGKLSRDHSGSAEHMPQNLKSYDSTLPGALSSTNFRPVWWQLSPCTAPLPVSHFLLLPVIFESWEGFPGSASGKEFACQCRKQERCVFESWVGKIPWRRAWQPTPAFLPRRIL